MNFDDDNYEWHSMDFVPSNVELVSDAIIDNISSLFYNVFKELSEEEIAYNIDCWIANAIDRNRPEFTAFLLDYKAKHNLYNEPDWSL